MQEGGRRSRPRCRGFGGLGPCLVGLLGLALASPASAEGGTSARVVLHEAWARDLVRALGLEPALDDEAAADDAFTLLCAEHAQVVPEASDRGLPDRSGFRIAAEGGERRRPTDPVRVLLSVPAPALYILAVEGEGRQRWTVDQRVVGHMDLSALGVARAPAVLALRRGPHEVTGYLGRTSRVERVELAALRTLCVAPADGWHEGRPLTVGAMARTLVRATGLERRLPTVGDGRVIEGERYETVSALGGRTNRQLESRSSGEGWAVAVGSPAEFTYRTRLEDPGLFTLLARVHGDGSQVWSIDGRYQVTVHPSEARDGFAWTHVVTLPLRTGDHVVRALIPRDAGIDALKLVKRRSDDADYVDVLERAGFSGGAPHAVVTRRAADEGLANRTFRRLARGFLRRLERDPAVDPLPVVETHMASRTTRPLSPLLPADL